MGQQDRQVLVAEDLRKSYGPREALRGLSFSLNAGHILGFLGPNGAGKTTTIRIIAGLVRPTAGYVRLQGSDVASDRLPASRGLRTLVEVPAFYPNLSGRENLRIHAILCGAPESDVTRLLEAVGLREAEGRAVGGWSLGMRQRLPRAEMLVELMRLKYSVLVAGAHGKTTTTSMVSTVLARGGMDPTVVIGGRLNTWGTNAKLGKGDFMVAEADESDGTFLLLPPTIAVVTNIDLEHLDYYRDLEHIQRTFLEFINKIPFYGQAVLCLEDENIQTILPQIGKRFATYGFSSQADFQAWDIKTSGLGSSYRAFHQGEELGEIEIPIPGRHNVLNSLAAVAVARELDLDWPNIRAGLRDMTGVHPGRPGGAAGESVDARAGIRDPPRPPADAEPAR